MTRNGPRVFVLDLASGAVVRTVDLGLSADTAIGRGQVELSAVSGPPPSRSFHLTLTAFPLDNYHP